jgi:hypothetical protein
MVGWHYVITGCIAEELLPHHSYVTKPGVELTREQETEMTRPYADYMAPVLKGKALQTEHMFKLGPVGEILHSWVDDNGWMITCRIDTDTIRGNQLARACLSGHATELSLGHNDDENGLDPVEVSVVKRGARANSKITKFELLNDDDLQRIRDQVYKPTVKIPVEYLTADIRPPRICCSWDPVLDATPSKPSLKRKMNHIALRKPVGQPEYTSDTLNDPEVQKILHNVEMNAQRGAGGGKRPRAQEGGPPPETEESLMRKLHDLQERKRASGAPPASHQDRQFDAIAEKLGSNIDSSDGRFTGNTHIVFEDPADSLPVLLNIVNKKGGSNNVLTSSELQTSRDIVTSLANHTMATRTELEKAKAENERMKTALQAYEKDKHAARMDATSFFEEGGIDPKTLEKFMQYATQGKDSEAMNVLMPAAIQCSARRRNTQPEPDYSHTVDEVMTGDDAMNSDPQGNQASVHQLNQILKRPNARSYTVDRANRLGQTPVRVQASAKSEKRTAVQLAQERNNNLSSSYAAGSGTWGNSGVDSSLTEMFVRMDRGLDTSDKFAIPEKAKRQHFDD